MDVDEFLDREVQVKKKVEVEKKPIIVEAEEQKTAVKHYFELWNKISKSRFQWDAAAYEEISKVAERVKEDLAKTIPEVKRRRAIIKQLIGKTLILLGKKDYAAATKLYSEICEIRDSLPDFFLEERKELNTEIFMLYEKLHEDIDSKFIADFKDSISKVRSHIQDAASHLDSKNMEDAKNFYERAIDAYTSMSEGFLQEKIELGAQLAELYKDISISMQIQSLQQKLDNNKILSHSPPKAEDKLRYLSGIASRSNKIDAEKGAQGSQLHSIQSKNLLSKLIARKLDRAKAHLQKNMYADARRNIESVLRVEPENEEARQLLKSLPVGY
ncbi:hypothetical protein HYX01_03305 [Candidatus Woesearchaeota archaeon]|nr:hypothetical protein [Candidatus Woesearchaeota archaeon]